MKRSLRLLGVMAIVVGMVGVTGGVATAGADKARPFHFSQQSDFYVIGQCESGAPLQEISGTGHGSHLGRVTISGQACADAETGNVTWTAANGDAIHFVFATVLLAPPGPDGSAPVATVALEVTGTGRFANVQFGEGSPTGTIWFHDPLGLSGHIETEFNSTITYDASDRRN